MRDAEKTYYLFHWCIEKTRSYHRSTIRYIAHQTYLSIDHYSATCFICLSALRPPRLLHRHLLQHKPYHQHLHRVHQHLHLHLHHPLHQQMTIPESKRCLLVWGCSCMGLLRFWW